MMLKKSLILAILILNFHIATAEGYSYEHHQRLIAQGEIHGIFNLYTELNGKPAITRAKELDVTHDHYHVWDLIGTYYQDSGKLKTDKQKALFAYHYLLKIASQANFRASIGKSYHKKDHLRITIFEKDIQGINHAVIKTTDMKTVYPQLMELIKSQTPVNFNLGYDHKKQRTININRHQSANLSAAQA